MIHIVLTVIKELIKIVLAFCALATLVLIEQDRKEYRICSMVYHGIYEIIFLIGVACW